MGPRRRDHGGERRLPARVTLRVVTNESTAANLMLTGGLNLVEPLRRRPRAAEQARTSSGRRPIAAPLEFFFNQNPGHPGANAAVRKALVQAMNLRPDRHGRGRRASG